MKRAPFLGASAAVFITGCGGHQVIRALPGVAPSSKQLSSSQESGAAGSLVPPTADAIPANVLNRPIIGEARRFDGPTPPSGWVIAQGQTLDIAQNRSLFAVLGTAAGGDGKTTFRLLKPKFGLLVAVAGTVPASPTALAQMGRKLTLADSLGPNAIAQIARMPKPLSAASLADRRILASRSAPRPSSPVRSTPEQIERIRRANEDAGTAATAQLTQPNGALLQDAAQRYLAGRIALYDAVQEMAGSLTNGEADAILGIRNAMIRQFDPASSPSATEDARGEASRALFAMTITQAQIADASARGIELR